MKKTLVLPIVMAAFIFASCKSEKTEPKEEMHFSVTSPLRMDTIVNREYVCQIHSINHIELRAQERGYLQKIFVDEGQYVKKDQLLFKIMPNLYEAEVMRAQSEVQVAEIEVQNNQALFDKNVVSKNELAMAKAKLNKAKAELSLAQTHLQFTEIRAPFDGLIDKFHVRLGSLVDEGDLLTNLSDNRSLWVYFNVPESEYLDYMGQSKKDSTQQVQLLMANNELFQHKGKIETIEADFNNETGNIAFRATFPNAEGLLRHGETGTILLSSKLKKALIIPQKTTFEVLDQKFVYVIDKKGVVRSRNITLGAEFPHLFVVTEGLSEGDKILLEGLRKVNEGDRIKTRFISPKKVVTSLELYAD
jgi:membrane fusion protein (multidrug efflux system)